MAMKKTTTKKNQKPIELDAQFRFICPNIDCGFDHWLTLKQCQTKNFKVVCDCGNVFKPKQIINVKIQYKNKIKKQDYDQKHDNSQEKIVHQPVIENNVTIKPVKPVISEYLKTASIKLLCNYGFTELESENLVSKAFSKNPVDNVSIFVKYIIENIQTLEENNE